MSFSDNWEAFLFDQTFFMAKMTKIHQIFSILEPDFLELMENV